MALDSRRVFAKFSAVWVNRRDPCFRQVHISLRDQYESEFVCLSVCLLLNGCGEDGPATWTAEKRTPIISGSLPYLDAGVDGKHYFLLAFPDDENWITNTQSSPPDPTLPHYMPDSVGGISTSPEPVDNLEPLEWRGSSGIPGWANYRVTGITLTVGGRYVLQLFKATSENAVQNDQGEILYSTVIHFDGVIDIDTSLLTGVGEF